MGTSVLRRALALGTLLAGVAAGPAFADTPSEIATQIRQIEDSGAFTPPTPRAAFTVGKFDAATGAFTGKKTGEVCHYDIELREIVCEEGPPPTVTVHGVHVGFTVSWTGASGTVTVTVNGQTKTVPAGHGRATIELGRVDKASWHITANGRFYGDTVLFKRPSMVGAGVFTIKALPIGIAYEPPQDPDKQNTNTYTRVETTSTQLTSTLETTRGKTEPQATSSGTYASIATTLGNTIGGTAGSALKQISALVGELQSDVTTSLTTGSTTELSLQLVNRRSCTTGDHIGPGGGDKIVYLKDVRVVWLDNGKRTYLSMIGSNGASCMSVHALKNGTSPFDAATAQSLLAVDPLAAGGPNMFLPTSRYTRIYDIDLDPTTTLHPDTDSHTESRWKALGTTSTATKVTTDTMKAGLLAFLGVGPAESGTTTLSIASKSSRVDGVGLEVTTEATLRTLKLGASSTIRVYYDKAFSTVVYQAAPLAF